MSIPSFTNLPYWTRILHVTVSLTFELKINRGHLLAIDNFPTKYEDKLIVGLDVAYITWTNAKH